MGETNPLINWFGHLGLAYKYIVVFLSILFVTVLAGFVKVLYNRRKLKKAKQAELEAGPNEDTVELNHREKDEGDLFGIRAIEAGFYAGVAQSRPVSRRNSFMEKQSTGSTVVGNSSPLMKAQSSNASVHSLHLGSNSPPSVRIQPSEAELNGRRNHKGPGDMSLHVPPSSGVPRGSSSPTYSGSDNESDDYTLSRSADFNPAHYAPAPKISMPDALQVSYHNGNDYLAKSQAASYNTSPSQSPTPPSPGKPPTSRLPTLPPSAIRKDSRSPSPESYSPHVRVYQPNNEPSPFSSAAQTYKPSHTRDASDASSIYSHGNRLSTFQAYQAYQLHAVRSFSPEVSDESGRPSMVLTVDKEAGHESGHLSSFLLPAIPTGDKDSRLSDSHDPYYRNSHLGLSQPADSKRPVDKQSTIMEVDMPLASPMFPQSNQPGAAL